MAPLSPASTEGSACVVTVISLTALSVHPPNGVATRRSLVTSLLRMSVPKPELKIPVVGSTFPGPSITLHVSVS